MDGNIEDFGKEFFRQARIPENALSNPKAVRDLAEILEDELAMREAFERLGLTDEDRSKAELASQRTLWVIDLGSLFDVGDLERYIKNNEDIDVRPLSPIAEPIKEWLGPMIARWGTEFFVISKTLEGMTDEFDGPGGSQNQFIDQYIARSERMESFFEGCLEFRGAVKEDGTPANVFDAHSADQMTTFYDSKKELREAVLGLGKYDYRTENIGLSETLVITSDFDLTCEIIKVVEATPDSGPMVVFLAPENESEIQAEKLREMKSHPLFWMLVKHGDFPRAMSQIPGAACNSYPPDIGLQKFYPRIGGGEDSPEL